MTVRKKDIASYLGISQATVSLALNNPPGSKIAEETRIKILKAARQLGYKDLNATPQICFIIYNREPEDPVYSYILSYIEKAVREAHFNFMFMIMNSKSMAELNLGQFLSSKELKGVIVTGDIDDAITKVILDANIPYVFYGGNAREGLHIVMPDHWRAGYEATRHLIRLGHKKIALFCGNLDNDVHRFVLEGYRKALEEHDIVFTSERVQASKEEDGYEMCGRAHYLNVEYTGLICSNTLIQFGALQRLKELGVSVPADKSLIGYGYTVLNSASIPELSSVHMDWIEVNKLIQQLIAIIHDPCRPKEVIYLSEMLVYHGGTCANASQGEL
ncbi:LacI family DNA-binding transcriptional regulator [Paenibacillus eucommiae]|uniref:DNA-binding LacI/PurR family transcriptional regulator n=1 Tax=Paenibacillus eucommiae TaxID=1355755 RepID=A0ABS4IPH6_9BACL|nr:LacI family DNA-binding transcriptional regulator [Paenibacillus eucommiae]MBP1988529.1 DNA-binding LacI/PurR family transcriptional regulator [Paenibacillus eucommiae]